MFKKPPPVSIHLKDSCSKGPRSLHLKPQKIVVIAHTHFSIFFTTAMNFSAVLYRQRVSQQFVYNRFGVCIFSVFSNTTTATWF